jgi:hypothetical protein
VVSGQWPVPETGWNINPFGKTTDRKGGRAIFTLSVWRGHLACSFFPSTSTEVEGRSSPLFGVACSLVGFAPAAEANPVGNFVKRGICAARLPLRRRGATKNKLTATKILEIFVSIVRVSDSENSTQTSTCYRKLKNYENSPLV